VPLPDRMSFRVSQAHDQLRRRLARLLRLIEVRRLDLKGHVEAREQFASVTRARSED
jgi:hypothetical protein